MDLRRVSSPVATAASDLFDLMFSFVQVGCEELYTDILEYFIVFFVLIFISVILIKLKTLNYYCVFLRFTHC